MTQGVRSVAAARRKSCLPPRLSTRMAATRIRVRLNGYEQPFKLIRVLIYQLPASDWTALRARAPRDPTRGDGRLREAVT